MKFSISAAHTLYSFGLIGSLDDVVNIPRDQMPPVVQETLQRIGGFHPTYVSELEAREANAAAGK